ncbi:hypothetical protein MMC26_004175 [Xylographa opegraphella]|nr:hypothetical protein [Xylographa opegraphella]
MPTATPPIPLSFPPLTYAKLSPAPFLQAHLTSTPPLRPNARAPSTFRPLSAHPGSLTHTHGSAVVRVGDTAVVCGVRAEVLRAADVVAEQPQQQTASGRRRRSDEAHTVAALDLLVPNLELQTGCSPAHLPGGPPSPLAQTLAHRLVSLLRIARLVPLPQLQIWHRPGGGLSDAASGDIRTGAVMEDEKGVEEDDDEGSGPQAQVMAYWVLYIDVLFLSLDGGAFAAAWAAVLAALRDTVLPRAWWDADREAVLCSPVEEEARQLELRGWPVVGTFGVFEGTGQGGEGEGEQGPWILADPDDFEEALCAETVTVVVDGEGGEVLRVEKSGGGVVGVQEMRGCVEMVRGRVAEWREVLGKGA